MDYPHKQTDNDQITTKTNKGYIWTRLYLKGKIIIKARII